MNVAIFTDTYYPDANGIAVSTKALVDILKKHGHNVVVITSIEAKKEPANENGVYYISLNKQRKRSLLTTIRHYQTYLYRTIRSFNPDIIHNQTNGHIGQLGKYTADKLDIPLIYTYHVHYEEYAPYVQMGMFARLIRAKERRYFQHMTNISTEFIAPSTKIKNYLRKKGIDKYINIIPTGIDPKRFEVDESVKKDVKYLRKKYDIKDEEKVILYVGTLSKEKNIDLLINGFAKFSEEDRKHPAHLLIVGEGPLYDSLNEQIQSLNLSNRITLVGKVNHEKMVSFYALSDVCASASTSETQSMTLMEAMLSDTIVLAREDDTLNGVLEEEVTGFTFVDEDHFVKKIEKIFALDDKEKDKIIAAAHKHILENYSLEKFYERVNEVYENAQRKNW